VLLFALPFIVVYLSGVTDEFMRDGRWRFLLLAPSIMVNTNMLRTLFVSFLVPLGSFLFKTVIDLV
jgi:hypothetical protein